MGFICSSRTSFLDVVKISILADQCQDLLIKNKNFGIIPITHWRWCCMVGYRHCVIAKCFEVRTYKQ